MSLVYLAADLLCALLFFIQNILSHTYLFFEEEELFLFENSYQHIFSPPPHICYGKKENKSSSFWKISVKCRKKIPSVKYKEDIIK